MARSLQRISSAKIYEIDQSCCAHNKGSQETESCCTGTMLHTFGGFHKWGSPKWLVVFIVENPIKMDDSGVSPFWKPPFDLAESSGTVAVTLEISPQAPGMLGADPKEQDELPAQTCKFELVDMGLPKNWIYPKRQF